MNSDKTVLVTGGWSGIGLAVAVRFAKAAVKTIITGRSPSVIELARSLSGEGCSVTGQVLDL